MSRRLSSLALVAVAVLSTAALVRCDRGSPAGVSQEVLQRPGFVEPHTPGSGQPEEFPAAPVVQTLLGSSVDLNHVSTVRTAYDVAGSPPPRAILILVPGFLGGATTFDPLARDLVQRFAGNLEVWAIDRRPNQLEDRLGAVHAADGAEEPACQLSPPPADCAIYEGAQFYFADEDRGNPGDFPSADDLDLNLNGVLDPQQPLVDEFGVSRLPALMTQDDVRFMAYWGLDTYFRDWKLLVEDARAIVGESGLVLIGGHSQGTTWSSLFAAYDFDPDPAVTVAGHDLVDGLVLLEGGGAGPGSATQKDAAAYFARVAELASGVPDDPGADASTVDVFLQSFGGLELQDLATSGEVAAVAAFYQPDEPSLIQRAPTFGGAPLAILLGAPATNRGIAGLFIDDDYSPIEAFRASMGFSDDGPNQNFGPLPALGVPVEVYIALPIPGGLRTWKEYDDPTLPSVTAVPPCEPLATPAAPSGCAIVDNGPPSGPGEPAKTNGLEREVTPLDNFLLTQFGKANGFEWYFASGRPFLDFEYGRDSSFLVADHLANVDPDHEGPLVVTQNATMDVPVIAIGGSNGLTPEAKDFDGYLGSIATPEADKEVHILGGYAHLDPLTAADNEAVPLIEDFVNRLLQRKLLETF